MEQVLNAPIVVDPFGVLDCTPQSDGAKKNHALTHCVPTLFLTEKPGWLQCKEALHSLGPSMLPHAIPSATAAMIAGLSPRAFRRRLVEPCLVERDGSKIVLASLAAHLGRDIDAETYPRADRARDPARTAQRAYQQRKGE